MSGEISISFNTIITIAIIMVLVALFFVFLKLIKLLNELTTTVQRSHKTMDQVDVVLNDLSTTIRNVEPVIGDLHEKYFAMNEMVTRTLDFVSGLIPSGLRKKDDK